MREPEPESDGAEPARFDACLVFFVAIATWALSLGNGYAIDDMAIAKADYGGGLRNPYVAELLPLTEYFSSHYWAATLESDRLFRPLTILSFALRQAVFGDSAFVDHVVNVLAHAVASVCVLRLALLLGATRVAGVVAGLFFATMAVHAEAIANVVGRAEIFGFAFAGSGLLLAVTADRPPLWRLAVATLLFFLGFASKESALAWAPFSVIVAYFARTGVTATHGRGRRVLTVAVVTALPLGLWFYLRSQMIADLPGIAAAAPFASNPLHGASFFDRTCGGLEGMGLGLLSSIAPFWLAADWGAMVFDPSQTPRLLTLVVGAVFAAWLFIAVRFVRSMPLHFAAVAAFLGFALPVSNILVPIGVAYAERLYYAPSMGVALLVAAIVSTQKRLRPVIIVVAAAIILQAIVAARRAPTWKDDATLRLTDVERQPKSINLRLFAANTLIQRRTDVDSRKALEHVRAAIELDGQSAIAWSTLAAIQVAAGAFKEAIGSYELAVRADHLDGHHVEDRLFVNLGNLRMAQSQVDAAVDAWSRALMASRYCVEAFEALVARRHEGHIDDATLERLLDAAAARDRSPKLREIWDVYRALARPRDDGGDRVLREVRAALPRGIFADPLRAAIDARLR